MSCQRAGNGDGRGFGVRGKAVMQCAKGGGFVCALGVRASEDELGEVESGFGAVVFDAALPVGAKEIEAERVGGGVDFGKELGSKGGPLGGVDFAFEDGKLDALAVVGAVFGDAPESAAARGGFGGDVVGDEDEHGLSPDEGGIVFEVSAEVAGEEGGLREGDEAEGDGFAGVGMDNRGLFAFLPGDEGGFPGIVSEAVGVGGVDGEVFRGELAAVEERDGEAVGEEGAEFFHEVKGEGGAAGAVSVEESHIGVQTHPFQGRGAVVTQKAVGKRQ